MISGFGGSTGQERGAKTMGIIYMCNRQIRPILCLFLIALLARVVGAAIIGISYPMDNDEPEYYYPAVHIVNGEGYRKVPQQSPDGVAHLTAYRMPGPSLMLALGFSIFGESVATARIISAVFSAMAAPLMFLLTRRIAPTPVAVLAGLGCALYPSYVYFSLRIYSEPYFIPLFLLSLLLTDYSIKSSGLRSPLVAGCAWGLTAMVRPHAVPLAALICLYLAKRKLWSHAMCLALGVAVFLVPWAIRNEIVFGSPVFLATESGETLLGANNQYVYKDPSLHGMWLSPMKTPEYIELLKPVQDERERSRVQGSVAIDYLRRNPGNAPLLAYYKLRRWLTPLTVTPGPIRLLVLASYGSLLLLLFMGALLRIFEPSALLHIALLCTVAFLLITAVYWGGLTRGRLPLEILWIPWAASTAWDIAKRLSRRSSAESDHGTLDEHADRSALGQSV